MTRKILALKRFAAYLGKQTIGTAHTIKTCYCYLYVNVNYVTAPSMTILCNSITLKILYKRASKHIYRVEKSIVLGFGINNRQS